MDMQKHVATKIALTVLDKVRATDHWQDEPYRVCRRPLFLRECPDEKSKIHP